MESHFSNSVQYFKTQIGHFFFIIGKSLGITITPKKSKIVERGCLTYTYVYCV